MFRISMQPSASQVTLIRVEGTLDADALEELRNVCGDGVKPIRLDLSEVTFASGPVLKFLLALEQSGSELAYLPLLLRTQLEAHDDEQQY